MFSIIGFIARLLKSATNSSDKRTPATHAPSEISAADYKATVSKLKAGGTVNVKVYDYTAANVSKL